VCHRELGPEAFAVLPRVLLHELICHVGARDDDPPDPRSPFAEGLMDWASRVYLDRWSYELLGADMHGAATAHAEQSAESFKSGPTSEAREVGYAAASRLRTQRDLQDAPIAALAADVNAAERPRARKDALVLAVLADRLRADMGDLADVIEGERAVEDLLDAL
jgi:hypothetical protein